MSKYIDTDKLIKSVNNYQEGAKAALNPTDGDADYYKGKIDTCEDIQEFITSLQQEQPEALEVSKFCQPVPENIANCIAEHYWEMLDDEKKEDTIAQQEQSEVDLEKEIDKGIADYSFTKTIDLGGFKTTVLDYAKIARHFYELGLNARKEE